jgi:hypothetical protein
MTILLIFGIHACQLLRTELRVHVVWIWIALFASVPYFHDAAKVRAAVLMLTFLWLVLFCKHKVESRNGAFIQRAFQSVGSMVPELQYSNRVISSSDVKIIKAVLDCVAVCIAILMDEEFNGKRVVFLGLVTLLALTTVLRYEPKCESSVVLYVWIAVACRCAVDIASTRLREDIDILMIAAEAALSHLASTYNIDFDPTIH